MTAYKKMIPLAKRTYLFIGTATGFTYGTCKTFRMFELSKSFNDPDYDTITEAEIHASAWGQGAVFGIAAGVAWLPLASRFMYKKYYKD